MNYKTIAAILVSLVLLAGCAPHPDLRYYEDLYYIIYRLKHSLEPVGYDPKALRKDNLNELCSEISEFQTKYVEHKNLETYHILGLIETRMQGGSLPGDMDLGVDPAPIQLPPYINAYFNRSKNQFNREYNKYGISLDMGMIEQRAKDSLSTQH
jgi:hypothetical protein